jgi:AraC-like DNA-binding protein/mannose-6-phosphate isomerase-like protein (cupin superfamily)
MSYMNKSKLINFLETQLKGFPQNNYFSIVRCFNMVNAADWHMIKRTNNDHKIIFVRQGGGFYNIEGKREELSRGKVILVGSGCRHYGRPDGHNPPSFITIRFKTEPEHNKKLCAAATASIANPEEAEKLFISFAEAASMEQSGLSEFNMTNALLYQIILMFFNAMQKGDSNSVPYGISNVISMLNNSPETIHSVAGLAKKAGFNERYFAGKFKSITSLSPTSYMVKCRMRYASSLLAGSNLSVQEVAEQLGYSDAFVFSKQFKKVYGYSPSKAKYRG